MRMLLQIHRSVNDVHKYQVLYMCPLNYLCGCKVSHKILLDVARGRVVKADMPCSLGGGRRGFDHRQIRRAKRAFIPPLAICNEAYLVPFVGESHGSRLLHTCFR